MMMTMEQVNDQSFESYAKCEVVRFNDPTSVAGYDYALDLRESLQKARECLKECSLHLSFCVKGDTVRMVLGSYHQWEYGTCEDTGEQECGLEFDGAHYSVPCFLFYVMMACGVDSDQFDFVSWHHPRSLQDSGEATFKLQGVDHV
jgi:hypothetical protein